MKDFVSRARHAMDNPVHHGDVICSLESDSIFGFTVHTYSVRIGSVDEMPRQGYERLGVTKRKINGMVVNIAIDYKSTREAKKTLNVMQLRGVANRVQAYLRNTYDGRGLFDG